MLPQYFNCNERFEIFLKCFCNILCYVGIYMFWKNGYKEIKSQRNCRMFGLVRKRETLSNEPECLYSIYTNTSGRRKLKLRVWLNIINKGCWGSCYVCVLIYESGATRVGNSACPSNRLSRAASTPAINAKPAFADACLPDWLLYLSRIHLHVHVHEVVLTFANIEIELWMNRHTRIHRTTSLRKRIETRRSFVHSAHNFKEHLVQRAYVLI